jgi:hypothetical protein
MAQLYKELEKVSDLGEVRKVEIKLQSLKFGIVWDKFYGRWKWKKCLNLSTLQNAISRHNLLYQKKTLQLKTTFPLLLMVTTTNAGVSNGLIHYPNDKSQIITSFILATKCEELKTKEGVETASSALFKISGENHCGLSNTTDNIINSNTMNIYISQPITLQVEEQVLLQCLDVPFNIGCQVLEQLEGSKLIHFEVSMTNLNRKYASLISTETGYYDPVFILALYLFGSVDECHPLLTDYMDQTMHDLRVEFYYYIEKKYGGNTLKYYNQIVERLSEDTSPDLENLTQLKNSIVSLANI